MSVLKSLIKKIPGAIFLYHRWIAFRYRFMSTESLFTRFYHQNHWGNEDSRSGPGSDITQTQALIDALPGVFSEWKITSMLDIPCGDFFWMQQVNLSGIKYLGGDIVGEMIDKNKKSYESDTCRFQKMDLVTDPLPAMDLVFCRDCLVHLSYANIRQALINIKKSGSTYLLATTFDGDRKNKDIITGEWRPIDLTAAPFGFPEPLLLIDEACTEGDGIYRDKKMGLWKITDLNTAF